MSAPNKETNVIKRDNLPESLRWMFDLVFATERGVGVWLGSNPFALVLGGKRFAIATDGTVLAAVPCDDPAIPQHDERHAQIIKLIETCGGLAGEAGVIDLDRLRAWAGMPLDLQHYFDDEGCGPYEVPNYRPVLIYGAHFNANCVAHALAGFKGRTVAVLPPKSRTSALAFRDPEDGSFAIVMPRSDVIPTMDDEGLRGGWGQWEPAATNREGN